MEHTGPRRVLVVEDDEGIRETLKDLLELEGYDVAVAEHGRAAIEHLLEQGPDPDVIVLDLMMPVMNGEEFRQRQLEDERWAQIPVLVISAAPPERSAAIGNRFVKKPFNLETILGAVDDLAGMHLH